MKPRKASQKAHPSKLDRRIVRTRVMLGRALFALMQEKDFQLITVQQVLNRAGVGRSTFYVHYRDKDDLLLSDVSGFLESFSTALKRQNASPRRLLPVRELFTHIRAAQLYAALMRSERFNDVQPLARKLFARSIGERLRIAGMELKPAQQSAQAYALAGSFLSLLDWWVERGMKAEPKEMDDLFHRLAWSGLKAR